jgi:hypothetical protein
MPVYVESNIFKARWHPLRLAIHERWLQQQDVKYKMERERHEHELQNAEKRVPVPWVAEFRGVGLSGGGSKGGGPGHGSGDDSGSDHGRGSGVGVRQGGDTEGSQGLRTVRSQNFRFPAATILVLQTKTNKPTDTTSHAAASSDSNRTSGMFALNLT